MSGRTRGRPEVSAEGAIGYAYRGSLERFRRTDENLDVVPVQSPVSLPEEDGVVHVAGTLAWARRTDLLATCTRQVGSAS